MKGPCFRNKIPIMEFWNSFWLSDQKYTTVWREKALVMNESLAICTGGLQWIGFELVVSKYLLSTIAPEKDFCLLNYHIYQLKLKAWMKQFSKPRSSFASEAERIDFIHVDVLAHSFAQSLVELLNSEFSFLNLCWIESYPYLPDHWGVYSKEFCDITDNLSRLEELINTDSASHFEDHN